MESTSRKMSVLGIIHLVTLVMAVGGGVMLTLSYMTGYVSIVYGEDNSMLLTVLAIALVACAAYLVVVEFSGKAKPAVVHILTYAMVAVITLLIMLLLVDRVEAIGNCIVAPWDAGHGGEDSCYLAFGAMGAWGVGLLGNLVGGFMSYGPSKA